MKKKHLKLSADQIETLIESTEGCIATDAITVDGALVGFMYREEPDFEDDSGWRFFSGKEPQAYIDNPDNLAIYDVNTIANYDGDIIPLLDAPSGAAYERDPETGEFVEVVLEDEDDQYDDDDDDDLDEDSDFDEDEDEEEPDDDEEDEDEK